MAAGADEIEFDVRLSADGVPVVLHDPVVDRVTTLEGPVASKPWEELRRATIRGHQGNDYPSMGLTKVQTVLELFGPHVGMNIHVKALDEEGATLRMIQAAAARNPDRFIYIAGDETVLQAAIRVCPEVPRFCLARQREPSVLLKAALEHGCVGLQFRATSYDAAAVAKAKAHGLKCNLFYADTTEDARAALAAGIDGVLTNDIGYLRWAVSQ